MDLILKTPPTDTSIDLVLLKANKRVTHANEDSIYQFWLEAAEELIEKHTNRALMAQTYVLRLDRLLPVVTLPRPPLSSIVSVSVTDANGDVSAIDNTGYTITHRDMLAQVNFNDIKDGKGSIEIEYVAGVDDPSDVPSALRQAVLLLASHYSTSREAQFLDKRIMDVQKDIGFGVVPLCAAYRVPNLEKLNGGY